MLDWRWIATFTTPLIIGILAYFTRLSKRLTVLEEKKDVNVLERLIKLETDTGFVLKIIWEFLIAKVHNDNNEYKIDELLDMWKDGKLKRADDIRSLVIGLNSIINIEPDKSKRTAAELLIKMIENGIGIIGRM